MRLPILVAALTATATAQAGGHLSAELASYAAKTDVSGTELNADGWLYGGSAAARTEGDLMLALEGRALTGDVDQETGRVETSHPTWLAEGRILVGGQPAGETMIYAGVAYRHVDAELGGNGQRVSRNVYIPFGLAATGEMGGEWTARTGAELGWIPWGDEDLEANVGGAVVDETFTRDSGWQARLTVEIRRGALAIAPFIRHYDLGKTASQNTAGGRVRIKDAGATEGGVRVGVGF
jgi:hypothetical protein